MRFLLVTISLLIFNTLGAQDIPEKPPKIRPVIDYADILSESEETHLNQKLMRYSDTTSSGIVIVTLTSIGGYDIMDYAIRLGEQWGIGQADRDNGVLILIAKNDKKMAIATGYGMEATVTDAATTIIREEIMAPEFRQERYYLGLDKATDMIIDLASGEFTADQLKENYSSGGFPAGLLFFILIFFIFPMLRYRRYRHNHYGGSGGFWTAMMVGSMLGGSGRSSGSSWGDFSGGGGSFGGFGGGSFGGGGSAGSW